MSFYKNSVYDFLTQRKFSVWRHVLFILVLIPIGLSQSFFALGGNDEVPNRIIYYFGVCFSAVTLAIVYLNNYYLAPRLLSNGRYAHYFTTLLASVLGFVVLKYIAQYGIFSSVGVQKEFNWVTVLDGLSNLTIYTVCIVSGSIPHLFKQWAADIATIENLKNRQLKNSIDELKSRIQPDFLYATLDYAARKVKTDPEHASDTLFKLSELLKYQLYDATRNKVLLGTDIESVRHYLVLAQQNAENRFTFRVTVTGDAHQFIPPALFTPWVEEVVRHRPTELALTFEIRDRAVVFDCNVQGVDLSQCDFQHAEQKMRWLYGDAGMMHKRPDSIVLQLETLPRKHG